MIRRRLDSGAWQRLASGVYALPGHRPSFRRNLWVATLAAGERAVVSHWSAGAMHGLAGFPPNRVTLTVPHGSYAQSAVGRVFQAVNPPAPVRIEGLPVTSVARTLVDIGTLVGPRRLRKSLHEALAAKSTRLEVVRKEFLVVSGPGRRGTEALRDTLAELESGFVPPRSALEAALDAVIVRLPCDAPVREAPLPGREWLEARVGRLFRITPKPLIVEADGRRWHTRVEDFARDRRRDRAALRHGFPTARYVWEELTQQPDEVAAGLTVLLGL